MAEGVATARRVDRRRVTEELIQSVAREVEVTRRLYRSGESEYLIDGQAAGCATSTTC